MNYQLIEGRNPYDIHVYYTQETKEISFQFREKLMKQFPWLRAHKVWDKPIGPHPMLMWECDFDNPSNTKYHQEVLDWIAINGVTQYSILVHPHSTDGAVADHT